MAISFEKHRQKIIAAWKDVLDDKSTTDWSLFSYEGQTNELQVVSSGEGGLEELSEDLNSGKIMYAFVRIDDTKTNFTKFLLINWQGEGAPILRKGTCANHIIDVQKFLSGAHLTIFARTDDDIEKDRILKQLENISGSSGGISGNKLKESRSNSINKNTITDNNNDINEQKLPIGTNYNRVIPSKELNPTEMQNFWRKEEEEERHRIELEKERKRLELLKREEELRAREEKEFLEREKKGDEQNITTKLQPAHVPIKTSPQPLSPVKTIGSPTRVMTEADRMRLQRSQEARELIGSRVGTAKAMFTQNTSHGQIQTSKNIAPAKPVRNSIAQRINALNNPQQQQKTTQPSQEQNQLQEQQQNELQQQQYQVENSNVPATQNSFNSINNEVPVTPEVRLEANDESQHNIDDIDDNEEQYSTIKRSPHSKTNSLASPDETSAIGNNQKTLVNNNQNSNNVQQSTTFVNKNRQQNDIISEEDIIYQAILGDGGLKARALYDYQAADESEITFDPGDIITHIDQIDEGWWQGLGPDGTYGLFPANYVELIN